MTSDPQLYLFTNNKGEQLSFPPEVTLEDLVRAGVRNICLLKPEEPLRDGWYEHTGEISEKQV